MTERQQCEALYNSAFGEDREFDKLLFDMFFKNVETLKIDDIVAAMYFKIPCILNDKGTKSKAYYIYAVTTHKDFRHKGLMSKLFEQTQTDNAFYFLKPSSNDVIPFYTQTGFKQIIGTQNLCEFVIEVDDNFKKISSLCDKPQETYPIMIKGNPQISKLTFEYTLE